jgi:anti-sigma B factor antagonist
MTRSDQLEQGESAMSEPLQIETSLEGRSVCLALCGELTYATVPVFDEHVAHVFGPTRPCLVLDVRRLHFCDSIGLSALIAARRRADLAGGRLILRGVHGMLERVLHITGAGALFTVLGAGLDQVDHAAGGSERA